jgi:hypothetical protein
VIQPWLRVTANPPALPVTETPNTDEAMRTTPHDPAEWPTPPRTAPHADARMYATSPLRLQAHRALRLFVTAGTWAAGLCLVIGALVLVASAAGHAGRGATEAAARTASGHVDHQPGRQHGPRGGSHASAAFAGRGNETTRQFRTAAARWQIQWAYRCPAGATNGMLVVAAAGSTTAGAGVDVTGASGHGSAWLGAGAGSSHRLIVISTCRWRVTVMRRRRP